jgi:hypothetical protein
MHAARGPTTAEKQQEDFRTLRNHIYPGAHGTCWLYELHVRHILTWHVHSCRLDENNSNNIVNAAMKFSVLAYGKDIIEVGSKEAVCASTLYGPDKAPIAGERDQP